MIWWIITFVLLIDIYLSIKAGLDFYTDYSDPINGLFAVILMWIIPVGLGIVCAMIVACELWR